MPTFRFLIRVSLLFVLVLSFAACAPAPTPVPTAAPPTAAPPAQLTKPPAAQPTSAPTTQSAATGKPIRIGGTLPLTGGSADTGKWVEQGYRYWAEEINSKGGLLGRPVELLIADDGSSADKAVSLLEKAISVDKVDLLLGGYPGTSAAAQMAIAEKYKMVYVSMGGHMKSFQQGYKYSFGGPPLMGEWWYEGIWQWIESMPTSQRPQTMAVFTMNNLVGQAVKGSTDEGAKRLGIKIVVNELYDLPLATAEPLVAKAKAANADIMVANSLFPDGVAITKAMKALDYNPKLYLEGVGTLIPGWTAELKADGNYTLSGTPMHDSLPFPGMKELNELAKKRFNEPVAPQYFLFGYAWMQTLQRGVEGAKSVEQDAIAKYLRSNEISTVGGKFKFDDKGLPAAYNYATQVINGKPELVWPKDVKTADFVYPKPAWGK